MADGFSVNLEGAEELERKLLSLERKVAKTIIRKAVRAGAKPVLLATKNAASFMVGGEMGTLLSKNLQTRAFKKQRKGQYGVATRTKSDVPEFVEVSKSGQRNFIPSAIEFGHQDRAGGQVPAIPFMRSAFDATENLSKKIVAQTMRTEIELAIK